MTDLQPPRAVPGWAVPANPSQPDRPSAGLEVRLSRALGLCPWLRGALVILFSPLLDERAVAALTDLRGRGFPVVVVDVLRHEPPVPPRSQMSALAVRVWRLDRAALRSSLDRLGVPVVTWASDEELDSALAALRRAPVSAGPP